MTTDKNPVVNVSELKGQWALVTGASSGIGQEFCVQLARTGMNVVLVARRKDLLDSLSSSLATQYGVKTLAVNLDLTRGPAIDELKARLAKDGIRVRLLCNNAGIGRWGRFEKSSEDQYQQIISLNISAMISLCYRFREDLESFPTSAVVNVSSAACYQPVPFMAAYAASKAFIQSFSQALYGEWKDRGILVQTLVPGPTQTEFDSKAGAYESSLTKRAPVSDVVSASLKGLSKGDPVVVAAKGTFMQRFFAGLFPPRMVIREVGKMFRPPGEALR